MSFNNEDILTLAKAGFTAQQIAALNIVEKAPAPAPAPEPEPAPAPAPEPEPAPVPASAPAPDPAQASTMDEILKSVQGLTQTFQNGFIMFIHAGSFYAFYFITVADYGIHGVYRKCCVL